MNTELNTPPSFSATWTPETVDADLARWSAFLAANGITRSPSESDAGLVRDFARRGSPHAITTWLGKLALDALRQKADARRLYSTRTPDGATRWYVLSTEQHASLAQGGLRLERMRSPMENLATIPITLGVYFGARYACQAAGLDPTIGWIAALVAYVVTHRVVRGRWPLQRA